MSGNDINASIRQPSTKPPLMRSRQLDTAFHVDAKPLEMHVLALDYTNDHPAESLQVTGILLLRVTLTQITRQRIINTESRSH